MSIEQEPNQPTPTNFEQQTRTAGPEGEPLRPRIWVASAAELEQGAISGAWVEADQRPDQLGAAISGITGRPPEQPGTWEILDTQDFAGLALRGQSTPDVISRLARGVIRGGPAFAAWARRTGADPEALDRFDDAYMGRFINAEHFVEQVLEGIGIRDILRQAIPPRLQAHLYVNLPGIAAMMISDGVLAVEACPDQGVFVFGLRGEQ